VTDPAARARVAAEWGRPPPARPGRTADELLDGFGEGIRAALVVGEDPAVSKRDADRVRRRLEALDALVVLDVAPSGTTRHADVVLPAATGVERDGTITSLDRRVQRVRRTVAPPGEARPDFEILADLGRRLVDGDGDGGNGGAFDYADVSEAFAELTRVAPTHAGLSYGDADGDGRRWPADAADGVLYRGRFETPHGRAAFAATPPTVDVDAGGGGRDGDGDRLHLVTGGRAGGVEEPRASGLRIHPGDADERGVASGGRVVVSDGATTVEATATVDDGVRRGTVYLPAAVADPFLRRGTSTVDVDPAPEGTDGRE
jgi:formate dehydrogenase major subunit